MDSPVEHQITENWTTERQMTERQNIDDWKSNAQHWTDQKTQRQKKLNVERLTVKYTLMSVVQNTNIELK